MVDIEAWRDQWNAYLREEEMKRQQREEARRKAANADSGFPISEI
ncbi:MAG TPA: hypothetical protein PLF81_12980 [Candidatus Anammoximicrobium sp.]|nr:hypothetical protein [Candidatus Anammoximicrobium sp.]